MQDMLNSFGFLYHRFEPNLWWWELIEISNPNPNATPIPLTQTLALTPTLANPP